MLSADQKKQYLSNKYDDMLKAATKEASRLSGVPVRQVQEDLVRDRGFKHRKQAQMACRRILHSTSPSSGRMLEKTSSPKIREDRDVACGVPSVITMKSKAGLPVRPPPGFSPALCPHDLGSAFYFSQREGIFVKIACCWLSSHPESVPVLWPAWPPALPRPKEPFQSRFTLDLCQIMSERATYYSLLFI